MKDRKQLAIKSLVLPFLCFFLGMPALTKIADAYSMPYYSATEVYLERAIANDPNEDWVVWLPYDEDASSGSETSSASVSYPAPEPPYIILEGDGELFGEANITVDPATGEIKAYAETHGLGSGPNYPYSTSWGQAGAHGYTRQVFKVVSDGNLQTGDPVTIQGSVTATGQYNTSEKTTSAGFNSYLYLNYLDATFEDSFDEPPVEYTIWYNEDKYNDPFVWYTFVFELGAGDDILAWDYVGDTYADGDADESLEITANVQVGDVIVFEHIFRVWVSQNKWEFKVFGDYRTIADFWDTSTANLVCLTEGASLQPYDAGSPTVPTVSSTTPANSATDVPVDMPVTATFSEAMDTSTITADTFLVNDGAANISGAVTYSGTTATFTPAADLNYDTTYTATITTGAKDVAGNALVQDHTWSFTTVVVWNSKPNKPILSSPTDDATDVSLTPDLETQAFSDPDIADTHRKTRWQINTDALFPSGSMVLNILSNAHLTSLSVPASLLAEGTTYYWRARFFDNHNAASPWSDAFSFTTLTTTEDTNANGIPDTQEVDPGLDMDKDGTADSIQGDIKCVNTAVGDAQIGVKLSSNCTCIDCLKAIDPATIADTTNKPDDLPLGLISFKIAVNTPGDTAEVIVYLSPAAEDNDTWYKYDTINGWQDYSAHAAFSADGASVTLEFKDGGFGDADGTANGIIVDPSGLAGAAAPPAPTPLPSGDGGGCFISAVEERKEREDSTKMPSRSG